MTIPIIFVHKNNQLFLLNVLLEAKKSNPDSIIYLIGDESNKHYDFVKHINYEDLIEADYKLFLDIYEAMSPNDFEYERFCFLRWFLIRELLKKENLSECFCVDSDVLILQDLQSNLMQYKNFDFATSGISAHNCYIGNLNAISEFCSFMLEMYDHKNLQNLRDFYATFPPDWGICDMTMFEFYQKKNPTKFADLSEVQNGKVFDHNISVQQGFEMDCGFKNLKKYKNKIVCKYLESGKNVEFITLHFQGASKNLIRKFSSIGKVKRFFSQLKYNPLLSFKCKINALNKLLFK